MFQVADRAHRFAEDEPVGGAATERHDQFREQFREGMIDAVLVRLEEREPAGAAARNDRHAFDRVGLRFEPGANRVSGSW